MCRIGLRVSGPSGDGIQKTKAARELLDRSEFSDRYLMPGGIRADVSERFGWRRECAVAVGMPDAARLEVSAIASVRVEGEEEQRQSGQHP
jgi:hypothetical protein